MRRSASLVALLGAIALPAGAAPSVVISQLGRIIDGADHPVTGAVALSFALHTYPAAVAQDQVVWHDRFEGVICDANGSYAVVLGDSGHAALPASAFDGDRWLSIAVGDEPLLPWLRVGAVPYALFAASAGQAGNAAKLGGQDPSDFHDAAKLTGTLPAGLLDGAASSLATVGTITTGNWQATPVADAFVAGAARWDAKLGAVTTNTSLTGDGTTGAPLGVGFGTTAGTAAAGNDARFGRWSGEATGLDASQARTSLGLGTAAVTAANAYATAAQGLRADLALASTGGALTGPLTIGNGTPGVLLDVAGAIRLGSAPTCAAGVEGALRYNATTKALELCNGTAWTSVSAPAPVTTAASCKAIKAANPSSPDGIYSINGANAWCDMTTDGGGWTLVMKLGTDTVLGFSSTYWTDANLLNITDLDQTTNTNAKYATFLGVTGTALMARKQGSPDFMLFTFASALDARTIFTNGTATTGFSGTWYPTPSHNTSCTASMGPSAQTHGVNFTASADGGYTDRARLGHFYEVYHQYHCNFGLGINSPGYSPTCDNKGSCDGSVRLFIR